MATIELKLFLDPESQKHEPHWEINNSNPCLVFARIWHPTKEYHWNKAATQDGALPKRR